MNLKALSIDQPRENAHHTQALERCGVNLPSIAELEDEVSKSRGPRRLWDFYHKKKTVAGSLKETERFRAPPPERGVTFVSSVAKAQVL